MTPASCFSPSSTVTSIVTCVKSTWDVNSDLCQEYMGRHIVTCVKSTWDVNSDLCQEHMGRQ